MRPSQLDQVERTRPGLIVLGKLEQLGAKYQSPAVHIELRDSSEFM